LPPTWHPLSGEAAISGGIRDSEQFLGENHNKKAYPSQCDVSMSGTEMAHIIGDLTLDQVVLHLIAGEILHIAGGDEFSLPLNDSRAILAFYNQDRKAYWNPDKTLPFRMGKWIVC
jgi:hypothetical protein